MYLYPEFHLGVMYKVAMAIVALVLISARGYLYDFSKASRYKYRT